MVELLALGNAEIVTENATLTPSQEIVFASALYLVLERERRTSRSALAELLWPTIGISVRAHRLRQTLFQLKRLGFPVCADRNNVRLSVQDVVTDADPAQVGGSVMLQRKQCLVFLPGYSPRFSEPFRDWVDDKRSHFNATCSRVLVETLGQERAKANWSRVEEIARVVLELDPYNESAVLAFAEASAMRGQKREAVSILDEYLRDVGGNADIRIPASILRKRILDTPQAASTTLPDPAFVGRQAEVQAISTRLKDAQKKRGGACLLVGEPGIGKSRLAAELAKFAALQGIRTQTVSCQRPNVDRPLAVLVDLVPSLREMPGAIGCSQETLLALRRLTEFDTRRVELSVSTAESHALHRTLRNALFDLLDAITDEVTLLLIFDDIQWVDRISADILAEMIAWSKRKRLLLILNSRKLGSDMPNPFAISTPDIVELSALTNDAAEALLTSILGARTPIPSPLQSRWILKVGEGNPFFLQELAKHWIESGGRVDGPSSVNNVLKDRLSRVTPVSLKLLQACTVLGQSSTIDRVERVLEYASHELLSAIQELSGSGMLSCADDSAEITALTLRTRHDLLASAVLEGLASASRSFLHRRAAIVLEKELSGDRISTAGLWACAFHWEHAGDRNRALSVVRSYSQHLLEVGLPDEASQALDRALEYCSTEEERVSLLARQVEVLQMAGHWDRSKEVLRSCRELRSRLTPISDQHDAFELMLFDASWRTSVNVLEILPDILPCVQCKEASAEHRIQAAVIALKLATDFDQAILDSVFHEVEPLFAETSNDLIGRVEAEMVYHSIRGDREKGLAAARALVRFARESRDPARLVTACINAANSYRISGTGAEAEDYIKEAISCALKHHLLERAKVAMQYMVRLRLSTGDIRSAREMLDRSNTLPISPANLPSATEQHVLEARVALDEGEVAKAERAFSIVRDRLIASTGSRKVSALSLNVRFGVLAIADAGVLRPMVAELEAHQLKIQALGFQDFEIESLFIGLSAIGEDKRGLQVVDNYLTQHRRDMRPPSPGLAAVAACFAVRRAS